MAKDKDGNVLKPGDLVKRLKDDNGFAETVGVYPDCNYIVSEIVNDHSDSTIKLAGNRHNFKSYKFRLVKAKGRYASKREYVHARK